MTQPWHRRVPLVLAVILLLPPLGLILLWLRSGTPILARALGSLAALGLTGAYLFLFFGLRVEVDGTGKYPIVSFHDPERHYDALVQSRIEQSPPPAVPEFVPPSKPAARESLRQSGQASTAQAALAVSAPDSGPPSFWKDFRGPHRDGVYSEMEIRTSWPREGPPLLWKQPVGGGYASFAVAGGRAFTIEQRRHQEVVTAYDVQTGQELWAHAWDAEFRESMGGDGPRSTPIWDNGHVYALGAAGHLVCLEAETGSPVWSFNMLEQNGASNLTWGMAASPLIVDDKVIVLPGGRNGRSVVAYDKRTGDRVWNSLDDQQAYTAPMLVTLAEKRQILVVSANRAMGLEVENGRLLWEYPWKTSYGINSAQPIVVGPNRFFISAGYGHGAAVVEVTQRGGGYEATTVWENLNMKNKFNSSVLHEGHVYGLDEGILACVNVETGARAWKGGRYGYGQLILASGHLIVLTESGELVLVRATPERHQEVARFSALSGKTWNHPALDGGILLVRNTTQMAAFNLRP